MKAMKTTMLEQREADLCLPFYRRVYIPFAELAFDTLEATSQIVGQALDTVIVISSEIPLLRSGPRKHGNYDDEHKPASHLRFVTSLGTVLAELKRDAGISESASLVMPALMIMCPLSPSSGLVMSSMLPPTQLLYLTGVLASLSMANTFLKRHKALSARHLLRTGAFVAALNSGLYVILASNLPAHLAVRLPMAHTTMFVHGAAQLLMAPVLVRNLAILMGSSTADAIPAMASTMISASAYMVASFVGNPCHAMVLVGSGALLMHTALSCLAQCHSTTSSKLGDLNHMQAYAALDLLTTTSRSAALVNALTVAWRPLDPQTEISLWFFIDMFQNLGVTHLTLRAPEALETAETLSCTAPEHQS